MSVALFSAQPPRAVSVAAAGPGAWWALCASCERKAFVSPLSMPAVREFVGGGPITVRDSEHAQIRTANGMWHVREGSDGAIEVILTLSSERYVGAVLTGEMSPGEHVALLRAKAVVARSAIFQDHAKSRSRSFLSDTCDSKACGPISLAPVSDLVNEAVLSTAGETLWRGSTRARVTLGEDTSHTVGPKLSSAVLFQPQATEMARMGKSYRDILAAFYPGMQVRITGSDEGWKQTSRNGIAIVSTTTLAPQTMGEIVDAWTMAKSRFPPCCQVTPYLVFAPTTEIFRQLTSQPGWLLASTSGAKIVLQPATVFEANHVALGETLRHEMLHVAVESSASAKTPLWLREGIVEALAGEARQGAPSLSAQDTERLLRNVSTQGKSQAAHKAAGARVQLLSARYGFSSVRDWLIAGSPVPTD